MIRVGILTYHRSYNYGAYLQACALCGRLNQEEDIEAEIIDFRTEKEKKHNTTSDYGVARKAWRIVTGAYQFSLQFEKTFQDALNDPVMKRSKDSLVSDSLEEFAAFVKGKYDVIVVGSDEIWKTNGYRGFPTAYWLIGDLGCKKMSYAASGRVDYDEVMDAGQIRILEDALADFDYISVRDEKTRQEIAKHTDKEVHMQCDPSFLYDFTVPELKTEEILPKGAVLDPGKKTVVVMVDNIPMETQVCNTAKKKYNVICVNRNIKGVISVPTLKPLQWLAMIRQADFVVTSFFHGTCFSIISNTPFLSVGTKRKSSKLTELLTGDDLPGRYLDSDENANADFSELIDRYMTDVDFSAFVAEKRKGFDSFLTELRK